MSAERIKALEIHHENAVAGMQELKQDMTEFKQDMVTIKRELQEINRKMDSQRGYIAGAMSVIVLIWSGIVAVVVAAWDTIIDRLQDMWL